MSVNSPTRSQLLLLFLAALIPRLIGALWLPNVFGDAYAYTEQIYYLRRGLLTGSLTVANLFGFWLPLYQLICASISAITGSPFYVPKVVSAVFGGGICVLVYLLTWRVTSNKRLSLISAILVLLNPYHIAYSSSAMTDVPHAFFVLLCAYCCIKHRWLMASMCAVAAGLMRIETWILIPIIPLAQFLSAPSIRQHPPPGVRNTRNAVKQFLTPTALGAVLLLAPLTWLFVCWKATGSFESYFQIRNNYIVETLASNPWLTSLSPARVGFDLLRLVYTGNPLVMYAAVAMFVVLLKTNSSVRSSSLIASMILRLRNLFTTAEGLVFTFFSSHLAFLLVAYFTDNQPEIWPRYGLIFFTLGLPLFASYCLNGSARFARLKELGERIGTSSLPLTYATAVLFALQFCVQLVDITRITVKSDPNLVAAEFLEDQRNAHGSMNVYCEDGAIRVLSGIPLEEFKDQYNSPSDEEAFLESLKDNQIRFLVYKDLPGSRLKQMIARIRARSSGIAFEEIVPTSRRNVKDHVIVYRVHENELAKHATKHSKSNQYHRR